MTSTATCPCCGSPLPENGGISMDVDAGIVMANGRFARLTRSEMDLWLKLWSARPRLLSRATLTDTLYWQRSDAEAPSSKVIEVMICHMRKKLSTLGLEIQTEHGRGFRAAVRPPNGDDKS